MSETSIPQKYLDRIGEINCEITIVGIKIIRQKHSDGNIYNSLRFECKCSCGKIIFCRPNDISTRCKDCYLEHYKLNPRKKHGMNGTPEYICWLSAKNRCYLINGKAYKDYGARGIKMCDRWRESFENFFSDMGPKPEPKHLYSIDRIDPNGNYEPNNSRWVKWDIQAKNKRPLEAKYIFNCEWCGISFYSKLSHQSKWCSKSCSMKAYRLRLKSTQNQNE